MDIVYFVRDGDDNEELRYSLRSLENIPHGTVHIVGYKPTWVTNVNHIEVKQDSTKNQNTTTNMEVAAWNEDISDDFILMNDDFFIMRPIDEIPHLNRGSIDAVAEYYKSYDSAYYHGMIETKAYMEDLGLKNLLSYELHIPMVFNKDNVIDMFDQYHSDVPEVSVLHKRTLYGNMFNYDGDSVEDVKVYTYNGKFDKHGIFLSTQDNIWQRSDVGKFIRNRFPEKSIYER